MVLQTRFAVMQKDNTERNRQHCYTTYNTVTQFATLLHNLQHCYRTFNTVTKLTTLFTQLDHGVKWQKHGSDTADK